MPKVTPTSSRKADHLRINLDENVQSGLTTGLERYQFIHQALPEINFVDVDPGINFFGNSIQAPILISSMTGGTKEAGQINQTLAIAAQETGIAMGLGSQRVAIEHPELVKTFQVRNVAPDILLFANIGAVQLNYGYGVQECRQIVEMVEADALILHFNPLQEAVQPEGNTNFSGLLDKIEDICSSLPVPVIAKEVGWGIDVAGAGGTSWTQVEMHRAKNPNQVHLANSFLNWGIPTAESIIQVHQSYPHIPIIASGGIRSGLDIAKCIALGATMGGMAGPFLKSATESLEATIQAILDIKKEIRISMFASGASCLDQLSEKLTAFNNNE